MTTFGYDIEVFKYDWLVCLIDIKTGERFHCWNGQVENFAKLQSIFANPENLFGGFNNKHYDDYVVKAILYGADTATVKELNDWIVVDNKNPWEFDFLRRKPKTFSTFDARDDLPRNLSLKAIEGNMNLPIVESSVPFDIDRPLTNAERLEVEKYCFYDVESAILLIKERKDYFQSKITLAGLKDSLTEKKALSFTNAKLAAVFLNADGSAPTDDERKFVFPKNLKMERIPKEVIQFFERLYDSKIPDKTIFKSTLEIVMESLKIVYGFGGVHAGKERCNITVKGNKICRNWDVASLYPFLMIIYHLLSRAVKNPEEYSNVVYTRLEAKHKGDKKTAEALKLVINTTYGAMLSGSDNYRNPLYDPLMARSVCITGQLFLTDLFMGLRAAVPSFEGLNYNTDGVMFLLDREDEPKALEVINEWQSRVGLTLEEDKIQRYIAKDVNNYITVFENGKIKTKGAYVAQYTGGNFENNSLVVVHKAVVDYFVYGTPPEETIAKCDNIHDFQIIAKSGSKYKRTVWKKDGTEIDVQNCNRVYASNDTSDGTLHKIKVENGKEHKEKIASIPLHCLIDNENKLDLSQINLKWYIDLAKKRIDDYSKEKVKKTKMEKGSKQMATKKTETAKAEKTFTNVWAKLTEARIRFLQADVKKNGLNRIMKFDYFELKDIIPVAEQIFSDLGLCVEFNISMTQALARVINIDNPEEKLIFGIPTCSISPITNKKGEPVQNEIQCVGAVITYARRYLYQVILDIVEQDVIDSATGNPIIKADSDKPVDIPRFQSPKSNEQREQIAKELTATDEPMDDVQKEAIKNGLKKLQATGDTPEINTFISEKLKAAKSGLTKVEADRVLTEIKNKIQGDNSPETNLMTVGQKASIKEGLKKLRDLDRPNDEIYIKQVVECMKTGQVTEWEADTFIKEIAEKLEA